MKKFFFIAIALVTIMSCDKKINITQPTILIKTDSPMVFEPILISVTQYAEIDGSIQEPDYFEWSILNKNEEMIYSDFENRASIQWTPDSAAYYIIKVKIGYDNNKSISTLKELIVAESPKAIQKKMIGKWTGNAEAKFNLKWKVDLTFDSSGHYIGKAYELSNADYGFIGPFYFGRYDVDNPEGGLMGIEPSEDIPCTKFVINNIIDNKGYGFLSVGYEQQYGGNPYSYNCIESLYIERLELNDSNDILSFYLQEMEFEQFDWYLKYTLYRIE